MTRQATDQLYIELDYYYPEEYYVYTAEAVAAVASTATITCDAVKTVDSSSVAVTLFTVGVQAFITTSASTDLSATFSLAAESEIVKTANVTLETIVTLSLQADKIKDSSASLTSTFTHTESSIRYISYLPDSTQPFYAAGQALVSTEQAKFGTGSLRIPVNTGSGGRSPFYYTKFHIPDAGSSDVDLGAASRFSIGLWIYLTATPASGIDSVIMQQYDGTTLTGWFLRLTPSRTVRFGVYNNNVGETQTTTGTVPLNSWTYIRVQRSWDSLNRGRLGIAINGNVWVDDGNYNWNSGTGSTPLRLGNSTTRSAVCYLDNIEFIKGYAILGDNDLLPTVPATPTAYTNLLLNFNGSWVDESQAVLELGEASLTATATVTAPVVKLIGTSAVLASASTVSATGLIVAEAAANLSSSVALTVTESITRTTTVTLSAESTVTASVLDLDLASAAMSCTATVTATANVDKSASSSITANTAVTAVAEANKPATASLICQGFVVAVGEDLDLASAALSATAAMSCSAVKTARATSTQAVAFTQSTQPLRIKQLSSTQSSTFTLTSFETRLKDVFVSGSLGQVYFRNTPGTNYSADLGDKFIALGGATVNASFREKWALSMWVSGEGYAWSSSLDDDTNGRQWILFDDDVIEFQNTYSTYGGVRLRWTGQDTKALHHYLFYSNNVPGPTGYSVTLWVDGVEQSAATVVSGSLTGYTTGIFDSRLRGLAIDGSRWATFDARLQAPRTYVGAIGQYLLWVDTYPTSNRVPAFQNESERLKLYDNGYVDIGSLGTSTGLVRARDFLKLENYTDLNNRGTLLFGDPPNSPDGNWRQVGDPFVASQELFRDVLNYTATEDDDSGPFAAISTLSVAPITVLIVTANLNTTATVSCTAKKLVGIVGSLGSEATVSTNGDRLRFGTADLVVTGSELVIAVKTGRTLIDCGVVATVTAQPRADFEANASLTSTATISCLAIATKVGASTMQVDSSQVANNLRFRDNQITVTATTTQTTVARKDTVGSAVLQTTATLEGSPFTTWRGEVYMTNEAVLDIQPIASYIAASNMIVLSNFEVTKQRFRSTPVVLEAFNTQLIIGTKISLDPYYQLIVDKELSVKKIQQETGILTVDSENRLNTVLAENATLQVPRETSTWHIPYSPQVATRRVK